MNQYIYHLLPPIIIIILNEDEHEVVSFKPINSYTHISSSLILYLDKTRQTSICDE